MHALPRLLDVVALFADVPDHGLSRGHVGTVGEILDDAFGVDDDGRSYAQLALRADQFLVLLHRPQRAA